MAWIREVSEEEATGLLARIYGGGTERAGGVANIIKIMSLRPEVLDPFMKIYLRLMKGPSRLSRDERELLATVTSRVNDCHY